ncbi:ABC transporter permease [Luteimicrobium subarcticum]|uniref:Nucleoside ABC transporter membrane protein n=1 Tax=Luteimicrobium subarcticum TaxID=620910 RepID=A0A2M8WUJ5_9MICO|nr:ABC transporter permease [Luteimicrobium subarcticum]PJI94593.1 nucleoside ABC transporter membrane protein [Luteimicrobium subarcticum]
MSDELVGDVAAAPPPTPPRDEPSSEEQASSWLRRVATGGFGVTVLSFVLAFVIGAVLIAAVDEDVDDAASYFFSRPGDLFSAAWDAIWSAYSALFRGSVINFEAYTVADALKPLAGTMAQASPLIVAALAVAVAFRAGLFNIGAQGQVTVGATVAAYIGFTYHLPAVVHLPLALAGGIAAGAVWGGIAGLLKARTGAHEVIVTIMLNYVATYLLAWLLTTTAFQVPGSNEPKSPAVDDSAQLPPLFGDRYDVTWGFVVALLGAVVVWWLMSRSRLGFQLRAVGSNPRASRTAGISVPRMTTYVMLISGALAGLAGAVQLLGTSKALTDGVAGSIGFDAITVALLGRSRPLGIVFAGLLYGGLTRGGQFMEVATGTPIDIVLVLQALVVLFIAAPGLVRGVFRLPEPRLVEKSAA